jgi:predicted ATP-grasp superfamily ATP-dependent carboligase
MEIVYALAEKSAFQRLAEREGFPIPRGINICSESDLDRIGELVPPLIIKPSDKRLVLAGLVERAVRADTVAQARAVGARILPYASSIIVQEWIEGPDTEIFFSLFCCDRNTNIIGLFPGRKLVCTPPMIGSTAVCIAAPEAANELYALTRDFIKHVAYKGLGSLEFKRDVRTGRFVIIEPTVGRTDWQEEIATLCGINLPLLTYKAALGGSEQAIYQGGFTRVSWRSSRGFRLPMDPNLRQLRIFDGYFRWPDPAPAVYYYGYERLAKRVWLRANGAVRSSFEGIAKEH